MGFEQRKCPACGLQRGTDKDAREHCFSGGEDFCWSRLDKCLEAAARECYSELKAARKVVEAARTIASMAPAVGHVGLPRAVDELRNELTAYDAAKDDGGER